MEASRCGAPQEVTDVGDRHHPEKQPRIIVEVWQVAREQRADRFDDRGFVRTRLRVRKSETDRAKPDGGRDHQECRHQPERWAAELNRHYRRKATRRTIACIPGRILTSDPE